MRHAAQWEMAREPATSINQVKGKQLGEYLQVERPTRDAGVA
jgi:hypothetical protein